MNVWCVFIGAVLVTLENTHLRMDLLVYALSKRRARWLNLISLVATVIACGVVSAGSWALLRQLWRADLRSVAIGVPMVVPHAAVFVGFVAMLIVTVLAWRRVLDGTHGHDGDSDGDPAERAPESSK
jgi:TRAP-type C4-dicarboxylate transport system permease small subunit